MKYFIATLYLIVGIVLPVVYVNITEAGNIQTREWILILALFVFCTAAGVIWMFSNKANSEEEPAPKPKPSPFRSAPQRKVTQPAQAKPSPAPAPTYQRPRATGTITYPPPMDKPEIKALMEDVKNFIKLESWLMALQKANEIIHYYPDSPEADKVRGNINFLIQKVKGHD